jgi:hypothetical protein
MSDKRFELSASQALDWNDTASSGVAPLKVYIGPDPHGLVLQSRL